MSLVQQPSLRNSVLAGLQAGTTVGISLPLVWISPWSHLIGFAALGALVALFGRFAPERSRNVILFRCVLCQVSAVLSMSLVAWLGAPTGVQLALLALGCGVFLYVGLAGRLGAPGPLIFVFAAAASISINPSFTQVLERVAAVGVVAILAWVICAASETFRQHATAERPFPVEPQIPHSDRLTMAARAIVGASIAVFTSYFLGALHPAWAAMGALAVLQGTHLHINSNRALQRTVGTTVGAVFAWAVLVQIASVWTLIAVLIALQILTEIVIGANYALGQVLVTPMALLMTHLAAPHTAGAEIAPERVIDTLLGAAVGICISVLLSTIDIADNSRNIMKSWRTENSLCLAQALRKHVKACEPHGTGGGDVLKG